MAVIIGLAGGTAAHAQEKTAANAFAFIRDNMTDGSWKGGYRHCYKGLEDCDDEMAPIQSVTYLYSSYCHLRFTMNAVGYPTREIDLTKPLTVGPSILSLLAFSGPIRLTNGEVAPVWQVDGPSYEIGQRVVAAVTYLQGLCKQSTPW
ncbi:MAG TPA: hypothetical protein VF138_07015 [Caulobacteraceae bacterium]